MKILIPHFTFVLIAVWLCPSPVSAGNDDKDKSGVVVMNKKMFTDEIFDYTNSPEWKYKGGQPAIIDFYANWCLPCRTIAPIMEKLAAEYDGKIIIYKVNVDKEKELAAYFGVTSIPLLVFIPMNGKPKLLPGAADKKTYKSIIDSFLLKIEE